MRPVISKLPHVGTTIFTVMSPPHGGAQDTGAINLSQGFTFEHAPLFGHLGLRRLL